MTFDMKQSSNAIYSRVRLEDLQWLKDPIVLANVLIKVLAQDHDDKNTYDLNEAFDIQNRELIENASEILLACLQNLEDCVGKQQRKSLHSHSGCKKKSHRSSIFVSTPTDCFQCHKRLNAFNRSRLCGSCKYLFCTKCLWIRHILPRTRRDQDKLTYVCDTCIDRMQLVLDKYFICTSESPRNSLSIKNSGTIKNNENNGKIMQAEDGYNSKSSRHVRSIEEEEGNCKEFAEHSIKGTKSWFQSQITHVGSHLKRKKPKPFDEDTDDGNMTELHVGYNRNIHQADEREISKFKGTVEESDEEDDGGDEEEEYQQAELDIKENTRSQSISLASFDLDKNKRINQRVLRSASYDYAIDLSGTPLSDKIRMWSSVVAGYDDNDVQDIWRVSNRSYDDSYIIDHWKSDIAFSPRRDSGCFASILRFAVYHTDTRTDMQSFKRALRFNTKQLPSNRCTLELDTTKGLVNVRSVFIHRVWSFQCCDVASILDLNSKDGTSTAKLVLRGDVSRVKRQFEFHFDHPQDLADFKKALTASQSKAFDMILPLRNIGLPDKISEAIGDDCSTRLYASPTVRESNEQATNCVRRPVDKQAFRWLAGEVEHKNSTTEAALLIGPRGDNKSWGRVPGTLFVTNYRVLFVPSIRSYVPLLRNSQDAKAYVPLFAITYSSSSGVSSAAGGQSPALYGNQHATILSILCKDVRSMCVEVTAPADIVEEKTNTLCSVITKLADACQRYEYVVKDAFLRSRKHPFKALYDQSVDVIDQVQEELAGRFSTSKSYDTKSSKDNASEKIEISGSFAFAYTARRLPWEINGWDVYCDETEFRRQFGQQKEALPFLKLFQNQNGAICRSYPSLLLLPVSLTNSNIAKIASFRAKNRLPVVTYYHRRHRCVLVRSGQPLLGNLITGSSSVPDQLLIGFYRRLPDIIVNQSTSSPSTRPIYIFDARKLKASAGNRLLGKGGVETAQDYPGSIICHLNIANIYRMQSSYLALMKLLLPGETPVDDRTWLNSLDSTRWLKYVRLVLEGSVKIARALEVEGSSVLVHCSDGWDRTSQLVSLAQLLIDPFYRTIKGFAVLVQKEWCAFGHKFAERTGGDRTKDPNRNKSSPILIQFLDAVWQVLCQFPYAFEFTGKVLVHIANATTSGLYGTFLYDTRLQRDKNCVREWTVSIWTPVFRHFENYRNPAYVEQEKPIWPWTGPQVVRLWEDYFLQWHPKYHQCRWISTLFQYDCEMSDKESEVDNDCAFAKSDYIPPHTAANKSAVNHSPDGDCRIIQSADIRNSTQKGMTLRHQISLPHSQESTFITASRLKRHNRGIGANDQTPPMRNIFLYKS